LKRGWYKGSEYAYFLTNTVVGWKPVFVSEPYIKIVLDTFDFFRRRKSVSIVAFVVMPSHLHYIVHLGKCKLTLSEFERDFKKWISRQVEQALLDEPRGRQYPLAQVFRQTSVVRRVSPGNLVKLFRTEGQSVGQGFRLWRGDEKPEAISSREFLRQKIEYIHNNPVKSGFVSSACDYPYSSVRNYELNDQSLIEIDTELVV
jgi:putative transposase